MVLIGTLILLYHGSVMHCYIKQQCKLGPIFRKVVYFNQVLTNHLVKSFSKN